MSIKLVARVLDQPKPTGAARLVLLAIAEAAHDDGVAWTPQETIAKRAAISKKYASDVLIELDRDGWIITRKAQRGRRRTNVYRIVMTGLADVDYDRLPFTLNERFDESGDSGVVETDESGSFGPTSPDPPDSTRARQDGGKTVSRTVTATRSPAARSRNVAFDALADATGADVRLEGGLIGKSLATIRKVYIEDLERALHGVPLPANGTLDAALADEIRRRAWLYRDRWPTVELTPSALAKHWSRVATPAPANERGLTPEQIFDLPADRL